MFLFWVLTVSSVLLRSGHGLLTLLLARSAYSDIGRSLQLACVLLALHGVPCVPHGGVYLFQLMGFLLLSSQALLWVCFFQTVVIGWVFGADKFSDCVEQMTGVRPNMFGILAGATLLLLSCLLSS